MTTTPDLAETPPSADELNRLWEHSLFEERLFHDRMNFFSAMQIGLLGVFAILYNKEPSFGLFVPLTIVSLLFTLLWLRVQTRHWVTASTSTASPGAWSRSTAGASPPAKPSAARMGCSSPVPSPTPSPCFSRRFGSPCSWRCSPAEVWRSG